MTPIIALNQKYQFFNIPNPQAMVRLENVQDRSLYYIGSTTVSNFGPIETVVFELFS